MKVAFSLCAHEPLGLRWEPEADPPLQHSRAEGSGQDFLLDLHKEILPDFGDAQSSSC